MPKRKRHEGLELEAGANAEDAKGKRVNEKLYHGKKILHKAIKVAKAFERQKLGRRHKAAAQKSDQAELKRINDELESLKASDLSLLTEAYLYRSLLKSKEVKTSPLLPAAVAQFEKPSFNLATANVNARLCNSKPVKDALNTAVTSITSAMGVQMRRPRPADPLVSQHDGFAAFQNQEARIKDEFITPEGKPESELDRGKLNPLADGGSEMSDDEDVGDAGLEDEDRLLSKYNARIAGSSEDDDSDAEEHSPQVEKETAQNLAKHPSPSPAESNDSVPSEDEPEPAPKAEKKAIFLPSLTLGGYISGSDSQPSDGEERAAAAKLRPKNRRGQRARQQIWEKKYGSQAKHLQQQAQRKTNGQGARHSRDSGWDAKRGATSADNRHGWQKPRAGKSQPSHGHQTEAGQSTKRQAEAAAAEQKPLHPSWEAAKKAKQEKSGNANFKGTKMVFD